MAKKQISYREAIDEIEETIASIENEELDIDELSDKVRRVSELLGICKKKLHDTEEEVQKILTDWHD